MSRATRRRLVELEARRRVLEDVLEAQAQALIEQAGTLRAITRRLEAIEAVASGAAAAPAARPADVRGPSSAETVASDAAPLASDLPGEETEAASPLAEPPPAHETSAPGSAPADAGLEPPPDTAAPSPASLPPTVDEEVVPPPLDEPARDIRVAAFGSLDWERLIGVRLFSAIAGIALVVAAVFFLRYSVEHGWLQPPVRVGIGVLVSLALLIGCELRAARRYPVTANALDAAAIAILFATFFAAQARWDLIPAPAAFVLMALVTALAVLLSVRRESLFIAVLGLLGGFATPALLSAGEDRPIPLFGYLLLLNVGLSWVAYRKAWPILTWLTLALTTLYQWGWTLRFLSRDNLSLAMGIYLLFPLVGVAALALARGGRRGEEARGFERAAMLGAIVPLLFASYLGFIPEYGARPGLLFGFLLLVDAGLLAVTIARGEGVLHALGGMATLVVLGEWLATSYVPGAGRAPAVVAASAAALLFLAGPPLARRFGRPLNGVGAAATLAGPASLFVFAALAALEPAASAPAWLFAPLVALLALHAWRAVAEPDGRLYFLAAFFALAAQARWAAAYLTPARVTTAVAVLATFALLSLAAPILARRAGRPYRPRWGSGAVLLLGLTVLVYLSMGPVAPSALWGLALLLAIQNAGLFIESAAGRMPGLAQAGSVLSWLLLALWWSQAAGAVGVPASLSALTGLSLLTLGGHAWAERQPRAGDEPAFFSGGLYLGLGGHLFLFFIAADPGSALPAWPVFSALAVITVATSAAARYGEQPLLHAGGVVAAALVISSWATAGDGATHGVVTAAAAGAVSVYALASRRLFPGASQPIAAAALGVVLFVGELALLAAAAGGHARPPLLVEIAAHAANLAGLLWLAWSRRWPAVAVIAVLPAWIALLQWQVRGDAAAAWPGLLALTTALYAVFAAHPFVLGRRAALMREPALASVLASAMAFFGARSAFAAGGLAGVVGLIPLVECAVLALTLRLLVAAEPPGRRDTGRLALVAGAALAFLTVAVPLQLEKQWITVGWALEGAALAWLYRRLPHRGLVYWAAALLAAVFVRLTANPEVLLYEVRGVFPLLHWYLYTYTASAAAMLAAARWLQPTADRLGPGLPRLSALLPGAAVVLLFLLVNIEVADFHSTGPTIAFRFGATVSQDLSYTIAWLGFGLALLAAGIVRQSRPARVAAVALIAVTTFKCFLYDLASLEGLYRVASFVGLALSLALVALALQKFVLARRDRMV